MLETETATRSGGVDDRLQKAGARDVDQPAVNTSTSARKKRKAEKVVGSEQPRRPAKSRRLAPDLNTLSLASAEPHSRLSTMAEFQRALSQRHPSATNAYYSAVKAKTDTRRTMLQREYSTSTRMSYPHFCSCRRCLVYRSQDRPTS